MKLFLVIYLAGQLAAVVGPLPYDMSQCLENADHLAQRATKPTKEKLDGFSVKDLRFACEYHKKRPVLKDPVRIK